MENLTTLKETHIVTNGAYQGGPAIYGNKIVWMDNRNGNYDIYMGTLVSNILNANFSAVPISGSIPLKVSFTDKSLGSISSWEWSFGDGTTSTEQNPTHMYSTDGNYTVNLTVRDGNGIDSKLATIEVSSTAILPVIFSYKNPPTDPNHDGRYEDVNGNGVKDFGDVVAYYDNMEWIEENATPDLFDYNKNGLIDFDDVVKLYDML
jgi:beta propeller repeat protein